LKIKSIKVNTLANYVGQLYVMLIGLAVTPLYLQYLGAEAYGLVGFFVLLQAWMNLLDVGLTPTLGREISFARGKSNGFDEFRKLLKSFELIFIFLGILVFLGIYIVSGWLAVGWINAEQLEFDIISYCVVLMGGMIGIRWLAGLFRSGINGLEDQIWLNIANIILTSLRFVGGLALLAFISTDVRHFFEYQLFVGLVELMVLMVHFYKKLPPTTAPIAVVSFHLESVKRVAPFALSVSYTSGIWIFVSQMDKLVLSSVLPLAEFGYFSLVALLVAAIAGLTAPICIAVQPRMTYLLANGQEEEMLALYRAATQLVTLVAMSVSVMVALFSETLMYSWTGDRLAAAWAQDILFWYSLGSGVLAVLSFQYYLQIAHGKLKLHIVGATISVVIDVPITIYVALNYGALGAGIALFVFRLFWMLVWTPIVHRRFAPGLHMKWLINDVLIIALTVTLMAVLMRAIFPLIPELSRVLTFATLVLMGLIVMAASGLSASSIREYLMRVRCA
jgi:O-antigen/teichoic acid export membrane protein